jgi:hypothetical protein
MTCRSTPPILELFNKQGLVERHPSMLTESRVQWALRNRKSNGLAEAVYETRGGELLVHEPAFLRWFLNLDGRAKPRTSNRRTRKARARESATQQPLL